MRSIGQVPNLMDRPVTVQLHVTKRWHGLFSTSQSWHTKTLQEDQHMLGAKPDHETLEELPSRITVRNSAGFCCPSSCNFTWERMMTSVRRPTPSYQPGPDQAHTCNFQRLTPFSSLRNNKQLHCNFPVLHFSWSPRSKNPYFSGSHDRAGMVRIATTSRETETDRDRD